MQHWIRWGVMQMLTREDLVATVRVSKGCTDVAAKYLIARLVVSANATIPDKYLSSVRSVLITGASTLQFKRFVDAGSSLHTITLFPRDMRKFDVPSTTRRLAIVGQANTVFQLNFNLGQSPTRVDTFILHSNIVLTTVPTSVRLIAFGEGWKSVINAQLLPPQLDAMVFSVDAKMMFSNACCPCTLVLIGKASLITDVPVHCSKLVLFTTKFPSNVVPSDGVVEMYLGPSDPSSLEVPVWVKHVHLHSRVTCVFALHFASKETTYSISGGVLVLGGRSPGAGVIPYQHSNWRWKIENLCPGARLGFVI